MHDNYCFKCGSYTRVDDVTKLCTTCYDRWPAEKGPATKRAEPTGRHGRAR